MFGILGCVLCVVGSTTIVLHAPQEREIESVTEVWDLATEPGKSFLIQAYFIIIHSLILLVTKHWLFDSKILLFLFCLDLNNMSSVAFLSFAAFLLYAASVIAAVFVIIFRYIPQYGQTHIMVYIGVCSLVGSLSVCISSIH